MTNNLFRPLDIGTLKAVGIDVRDSVGLFIGVSDFLDSSTPSVPFAVDDAIDLAYLFSQELQLLAPSRTCIALSGDPVKAMSQSRLDELEIAGSQVVPATRFSIFTQILQAVDAANSQGILFVTVASHGFQRETEVFVAPFDFVLGKAPQTALSLDDLITDMYKANALVKFLVVDACRQRFTGRSAVALPGTFTPPNIMKNAGFVTLMATTSGGTASDDSSMGNGVFTAGIIDSIKNARVTEGGRFITMSSVARHAGDRIRQWRQAFGEPIEDEHLGPTANFEPVELSDFPLATRVGVQVKAAYSSPGESLAALAYLRRGQDVWNSWRQLHPDVAPNLSGVNLSGQDLSGCDLSRTVLAQADLSHTSLLRTNLEDAVLAGVDLTGSTMIHVNLRRADLSRANFLNATFSGVLLIKTTLSDARGLGTISHISRSFIDNETLRGNSDLPSGFLRACGVV